MDMEFSAEDLAFRDEVRKFIADNHPDMSAKKELGEEKLAQLRNISEEPVAAASIGQVHSAYIGSEKVAIKVQFPGVDKTIGSDLSLVRQAMQSILWIQKRKIPLDGLFEEFERCMEHLAFHVHLYYRDEHETGRYR